MLRVTKLTDYATVVLAALASAPDRVLSAADLAERARLEPPTVAKVPIPINTFPSPSNITTCFFGLASATPTPIADAKPMDPII